MSPVLFNVYMDDLSKTLNETKIGCHIAGVCMNNISYADDMVILTPSVGAMRKLLAICETYIHSHELMYNAKKSSLLIFRANTGPAVIPSISLGGVTLNICSEMKYLGHIITDDLNDKNDIERQRRALSVRANMLARRFNKCSPPVKKQLFQTYCMSLYTSELWTRYSQNVMNTLRVQYNHAYRALFGLPWRCSASQMFTEGRVHGFAALMRHRVAGTRQRYWKSENVLVQAVAQWHSAPLHRTWRISLKPP